MAQEQQRDKASFVSELVPDWRPTRGHVVWAIQVTVVGVVVLVIVFLLLSGLGWVFSKTGWDLLKVLAVPIAIGAAVPFLNWLQRKRELDVGHQRAQDEALQAYLDQMGQLLLNKDRPLRQSQTDSEVVTLARARTLTVLPSLDGDHKARVVQFLYESDLIGKESKVLDLNGADLSEIDLSEGDLRGANLQNTDLRGAKLDNANLSDANLSKVDLSNARARGTIMHNANLTDAQLHGADLSASAKSLSYRVRALSPELGPYVFHHTSLEGACLTRAKLTYANLEDAILKDAILSGADPTGANFSNATMPDGRKYEEWLESRGEDGENSGTS